MTMLSIQPQEIIVCKFGSDPAIFGVVVAICAKKVYRRTDRHTHTHTHRETRTDGQTTDAARLLPRDASAERGDATVSRPSVRP